MKIKEKWKNMEKKKNNVALAIIISIIIIVGIFILYVMLRGYGPSGGLPVDVSREADQNGDYICKITDVREGYDYPLSELYLKFLIFNTTSDELENTISITVLDAKSNYQNGVGNITYNDKDGNNKLSVGDEIWIRSADNGGIFSPQTDGYLITSSNTNLSGSF